MKAAIRALLNIVVIPFFIGSFYSCAQPKENRSTYLDNVGDTKFDKEKDDHNFKICNKTQVLQYYNFSKGFQYKGEKPAINEHFKKLLKYESKAGESGFITIRFIVNCEGKTGWFRVQEMDNDYKAKTFDKKLVDQLLKLTKQLDGWIIGEYNREIYDYYQYLTFKVQDGKLIEIMP